MKKCITCHKGYPVSGFYKDKYNKDMLTLSCKTCSNRQATKWWKENKERAYETHKIYLWKTKLIAFKKYGGGIIACVCCGESNPMFLTIDHINGGGNQHRKDRDKGVKNIYLWLQRYGYPSGFRTLCWNCNCGKGINRVYECPHIKLPPFLNSIIEEINNPKPNEKSIWTPEFKREYNFWYRFLIKR